jgi:hypothetical protein
MIIKYFRGRTNKIKFSISDSQLFWFFLMPCWYLWIWFVHGNLNFLVSDIKFGPAGSLIRCRKGVKGVTVSRGPASNIFQVSYLCLYLFYFRLLVPQASRALGRYNSAYTIENLCLWRGPVDIGFTGSGQALDAPVLIFWFLSTPEHYRLDSKIPTGYPDHDSKKTWISHYFVGFLI